MNNKVITSYKAFDKNMQCCGFQYEVGKEYEMDGEIKCCNRGFHACKSPLEVWDYYDILNSRYAEVEQSGKIDAEENTTKVCSSRIKIKAELKLADIINIGVEWLKDILQDVDDDNIKYVVTFGEGAFFARKVGLYTGIPLHECVGSLGNDVITYAKVVGNKFDKEK